MGYWLRSREKRGRGGERSESDAERETGKEEVSSLGASRGSLAAGRRLEL